MRSFTAISLFALSLLAGFLCELPDALGQCTHVKTRRLGSQTLRIRGGPQASGGVLGAVPEGVCLKVLQSATGQNINGDTTWYKITYGGATGWISGYYAGCSTCGGPPPECSGSQTRSCWTGSSSNRNKGECRDGTQRCSGGKWGSCSGQRSPTTESCNGKDDDCDGSTDEGNPGGGSSCSTGKPGACSQGTNKCQGGRLVCTSSSSSSAEVCNGKDDDCDGSIDEGNPQGGQACSTGKPGACSTGISQCKNGKVACEAQGNSGQETCNGKDDDCDGNVDNGLKRACYTGPANTNGVGICSGGEQLCNNGQWGTCNGELTPQSQEICGNGKDDNCNGQTDEGCGGSGNCTDGATQECYTGPPATKNKGYCKAGTQSCVGGTWSPCRNERTPQAKELCNNQTDDNCDGQVDEGCTGGPQGRCEDKDKDGFGVGSECQQPLDCDDNDPDVNPKAAEICGNGKDDDCKGGDLPCGKLGLGESGCTKSSECETNFCVKLGDVQRCSTKCKLNSDCQAGWTCIQQTACWPPKKGDNTGSAKSCTVDKQCADGERCDRGFCAPRGGCGCSQHSDSPWSPWMALLLFGLWLSRIRERRKSSLQQA